MSFIQYLRNTSAVPRADASRRSLETDLRRTVLLAVVYSLSACLAVIYLLFGYENPDLWWHLNTGAWIAQHHAVPATDPFSALGMSKPWVAYSWLYELMMYGFYRWQGLLGTAVYVLLMTTAIGAALYRAIRTRLGGFAAPIALTAVGLYVMTDLYSVRPWLFTILFFLIEIDILFAELVDERDHQASRRVWLLPVLFALWVNLHIQFIYGLAVLGLAAFTQNLEVVRGAQRVRIAVTPGKRRHTLFLVAAISFLATLANPYYWRVYGVILEVASERTPYSVVSELKAPAFRYPSDFILIVLILGAAFVLGRVRLRSNLFAGLLLLSATLVSLQSVRDEWLALVVALLIIAAGVGRQLPAPAVTLPRAHRFAAAALAVLFVFGWAHRRGLSNARLEADASKVFPVKAVDFVLQQGFPGPLFNDYNWGGYLAWRLPHLPVSVDSRSNIYGDARLARSVATWSCKPGWENDPDLATANLVIGPMTDEILPAALKRDPRFQLVYEDTTAAVFVKREK